MARKTTRQTDAAPASADADLSAMAEVADTTIPPDVDPPESPELPPPDSPDTEPPSRMADIPPTPPPPPVRAMTPPPEPQVIVQKVGAWPLLIAGVITAGLGFAVAWVARDWMAARIAPPDLGPTVAALETRLATLENTPVATPLDGELAELGATVAALSGRVDALPAPPADLSPNLAALADTVAAIDTRIATLERAPAPDGSLSDTAAAAWAADIAALQATVADQAARLEALSSTPAAPDMAAVEARLAELTAAADAELAAAQEATAEAEAQAAAALSGAAQRAAMDRILAALDAGTPFDVPLADLATAGTTIPDALTLPAADGVPTLAALQSTFPDAARAALAAARAEGLADDGGGFLNFLRDQLDVRSVTPRDGTDPDAVLSRAEAALRDARLTDALAEVASLPEVVRAAMSGWTGPAETRAAALSAAAELSETLSDPVP